VAAQLPARDESLCPGAYPAMNLLHIAGTADPWIPFAGGPSRGPAGDDLGQVESAEHTVAAFVASARGEPAHHEALPEADGNPATRAQLTEWRGGGRLIRQYLLECAGHTVPQREVELPAIAGPTSGDIDFGAVVLDFVASLPQARATALKARAARR
jgi:poly(3-hydroxybutyrate) depolymerase